MTGVTIPTIGAIALQLVLGLAVFQANAKRPLNQCFLFLSVVIAGWLASVHFALSATNAVVLEFSIRQAWAAGAMILCMFNLLRLSVQDRGLGWHNILGRSRVWLVATAIIVAFCQTGLFLKAATIPMGSAPPIPLYGVGIFVYTAFFVAAIIALIISTWRDLRSTTGGEHAELAFILIGGLTAVIFPLLLAFILGLFIEKTRLLWFAPFRVFFFSLVVAYGIATRKIMEVGLFFRRGISYALLTAYLLALYALVWWLVFAVSQPQMGNGANSLAHVLAAVVVAFAMAPARGVSQSLADKLFLGTRRLDFRSTMNEAAAILKSVTTLQDLLERFARTIAGAVATDKVFILLPEHNAYSQHYPLATPESAASALVLGRDDAIIQYVQTHRETLVLDELHRMRQTPELKAVEQQMEFLKIAVVMGIFAREHLAGVMLLGPRLSGRIYGSVEQNALQVLCGQLAIAIDNAQLFTEVQNAKIYNEILLQNLTTGVIAASTDGRITVFNNEAEQIIGSKSADLLDHSIEDLPASIRNLVRETLQSKERPANRELVLDSAEGGVVVRASSSIFHGQQGEMLGVLVVLTDITVLKRLELQIRRSDRLASLGTLSAGMAHEIKNPLVSIKTFAQLLPERYQDSDFRETFSNLIGHEIDRIDSLVNQLLRFARPTKPLLKPMHVHTVLEKSLQLVGHRLYQKEIKLTRSWKADVDTIRADADQLEQVFLNFFLNAMEAMKRGGEMVVSTEILPAEEWVAAVTGTNGDVHEILRITIRDTGEGIRSEDIPHVFDPFFTTKDYGTGLGLSVVHGIIQEHAGQIEVESELTFKRHGLSYLASACSVRTGGRSRVNPPPICILYSQDTDLVRRIKAFVSALAQVRHVSAADRLDAVLEQTSPALLLLDLRGREARDLMEQVQNGWPEVLIVALGTPRSEPLREAEQSSIHAAEDLQIDRRRLQALVSRAFEHLRVLQENRELRERSIAPAIPEPRRVEAISERRESSTPLLRFPRVLRRFDNVETLLTSVVEGVADATGVGRVGIFSKIRQGERYRLRAGLRCLPETSEIEYGERDALVRWFELHAHLICRSNLGQASDPKQRTLMRRALDTFGAEVIVPLHARGSMIGWLFFGHRLTGHHFDYNDLEGLMLLAENVSTTLENALLYEEVTLQKTLAETLLKAIPPGIIATDEEAMVRWFNPTAERILGITAADVLNQPVEAAGTRLAAFLRETLESKGNLPAQQWIDPNTRRSLSVETRRLVDKKTPLGAVAVLHDLTAEDSMRQKQDLVDRAAFWTDLAASMSHEIRNPLVAIKTFAQLLPERFDDADFRKDFNEIVVQEIDRLDKIITQINNFAHPSELVMKPIDVRASVRKAIELARSRVKKNGVAIDTTLPNDLPKVLGDETALTEAFAHLVANAAEATSGQSKPQITLAAKQIREGEHASGVVVTVKDNGKGISADLRDKVFSPFCTTKARGMGLGLPIVKRTIFDHNGRVDIDSNPHGTSVSVMLPASPNGH